MNPFRSEPHRVRPRTRGVICRRVPPGKPAEGRDSIAPGRHRLGARARLRVGPDSSLTVGSARRNYR
eukprot:441993-Hanusia_phi.AAC.2